MTYGEVIALANDQKLLVFRSFGDYQGDWIAITKDSENYFIYKGYYGSCEGCDLLQDFESQKMIRYPVEWDKDFAKEFVKKWCPPFIEVPKDKFLNLLKNGMLKEIMPANTRLDFSEGNEDMEDSYVFEELEKELKNLENDNNS